MAQFISAFIKLVRLPNLVFIALTQILFHYCVVSTILHSEGIEPAIRGSLLVYLVLASFFIAAAGYIINDYFDIHIDAINKPHKNVVGKIIPRRWAMLLHFSFSGIGLFFSFYLSWKTGFWYIFLGNLCCVMLLFIYSLSLKKKLLSGNILISLLTAWVIFVLSFSETYPLFNIGSLLSAEGNTKLLRLSFLYAGFAFITTLIREAIKDMEDVEGDRENKCNTMPIAWGVNAAKVYVAVWLVVLMGMLLVLQIYVVQFSWWWLVVYSLGCIILPFAFIFKKLFSANTAADFKILSNYTKLGMLTGILSLLFFNFYL